MRQNWQDLELRRKKGGEAWKLTPLFRLGDFGDLSDVDGAVSVKERKRNQVCPWMGFCLVFKYICFLSLNDLIHIRWLGGRGINKEKAVYVVELQPCVCIRAKLLHGWIKIHRGLCVAYSLLPLGGRRCVQQEKEREVSEVSKGLVAYSWPLKLSRS